MRPDKNKGAAASGPRPGGTWERSDLCASLHLLEKDLDRLLAFLDAYEGSSHPARSEAVRWLLPVLDRHRRALKRHRRVAAENQQRLRVSGS